MAQRKQTLGQRIAPPRFLLFCIVLVVATGLGWSTLGAARAFMAGFDIAAALFLASLMPLMLKTQSPANMRQHAADNDANRVMLLIIATAVSAAILTAIAVELQAGGKPNVALVVTTLTLAWLFGNTVYALHYAHVYYVEDAKGGLTFSGKADPDYSDFVYFAYTLGMTFQTSDTAVATRQLRRIVTVHSFAAFVFNIGVIAFSINVLGGG